MADSFQDELEFIYYVSELNQLIQFYLQRGRNKFTYVYHALLYHRSLQSFSFFVFTPSTVNLL